MQPKDIFDALNKVRQNPNLVINQIKQQLKRFQSNMVFRNKNNVRIRTVSGKAAFQQAILALERQKPKSNLIWNPLLGAAAEQYKLVASENDNKNPFQVIKNVCSYEGNISFNINESEAEQDLIQLMATMVVGDGDEKKMLRTAIFHPLYKQFACSIRKMGNKNIIYSIFAQNVTQASKNKEQKFYNKSNLDDTSSYRQQQVCTPSFKQNIKQQYIKKGKQLIAQLNKIRKQPKQYVHALKAEIQKFKDEKTISTDYGTTITKQGQVPYYDLISELQQQYPLPIFKEIGALTIAAIQQIIEGQALIESKIPVEQLLDKFCVASEGVKNIKLNNIQGMPITTMLMRLLVGDGDRKRTARRKMLSPICKAIGCAISKDTLVVNVGQSARDNQAVVEQYLQHLNDNINLKQKFIKQEEMTFKPSKSTNNQESSLLNKNFEGEQIVVKKTSKSHTVKRAGRTYKITEIEVTYDNGQVQNIVEQELVN